MKVLVVHNYYDSSIPSGENVAVDADLLLLRDAGIDVEPMLFRSDDLHASFTARRDALRAVLAPPRRALRSRLLASRPDVVHVHNLQPQPGPGLVAAARTIGVPVVQTVHNRRLAPCLAGTQTLDGQPCRRCAGQRVPAQGVTHACYRGNRAQSAVMAASMALWARDWWGMDHYFAVSSGIAQMLVEDGGIEPHRVSVKPNPVPDSGVTGPPATPTLLFAGRLEADKGLELLVRSWEGLAPADRPRLVVCGHGSLAALVEEAAHRNTDLEFLGQQPAAAIADLMDGATAVAIPSVSKEGLPRALAESFASGRPVLTTRFEESIQTTVAEGGRGWVVEPSTAEIQTALRDIRVLSPAEWESMSTRARAAYDAAYAPEVVLRHQLEVYEQLMARARR